MGKKKSKVSNWLSSVKIYSFSALGHKLVDPGYSVNFLGFSQDNLRIGGLQPLS